MTKAVIELLKQFKDRFDGRYPKVAQFDDGKEFYNVGVKTLLEKHEIKYFSTKLDKKAAIVKGFNRTLKLLCGNIFTVKELINGLMCWTNWCIIIIIPSITLY